MKRAFDTATIRTRIFLVYLLLVGGGAYYLVSWSVDQVRPRYLESMEESLVDAANLLASVVEKRALREETIDAPTLRTWFDPAYDRRLAAEIYSIRKETIDTRIYVTDAAGRVLYDSDGGRDEGRDYSRWRDVHLTLSGKYGARATRRDPEQEDTLVIHVAAPIRAGDRVIGVLTLGKPTENVNELVRVAKRRIVWAGLAAGGLIVATGVAFSIWLTTPIERLTAYARAVRDGRPATLPRLAGREVGDLRHAFEEMRDALEGKKYVERYTQALTHEIKAPLSAIRGAAELMSEDMPDPERQRFLAHIRQEAARIQHLIDQLLQLSALEARRERVVREPVPLLKLIEGSVAQLEAPRRARRVTLAVDVPMELTGLGDSFLLGLALTNLLKNALEFSPVGGLLRVAARAENGGVRVIVQDQGPGIPEFARSRIFERFYSLPRPDGSPKSTGLGLSLVQEIAHLHGGTITLENRPDGGCEARLFLPNAGDGGAESQQSVPRSKAGPKERERPAPSADQAT